jgi:hypothetical protein
MPKGDKIMKRLVPLIVIAVAGMAILFGVAASAATYPNAPPGTSVNLDLNDFIQCVPEQNYSSPYPNPVIGDNLGQHPGAFVIGFPPVGTYFIGVFGGLINTSKVDAAVYLWETSGPPNDVPFTGPQIQLGFWDGMAFTMYGIPQAASYQGTGVGILGYEITSSITPLSDFGITPGFPYPLNAVMIEAAYPLAHNQVTAVATNVIPEPSTISLLGAGILGLAGVLRRKLFY